MKYILFYGTVITTAASAAYEYDASAAAAASKILQLPVMPALFGEDRELMGHKRSSKSRSRSKSSSSKSGDGSMSGSKDDGLADFLPHEPAPAIDDLDEYYWWDLIEMNESTLQTLLNKPVNRRSHHATYFSKDVLNEDTQKMELKEWMIISGGFTDDDMCSFPVYAIELSAIKETDDGEFYSDGWILLDRGYTDAERNAENQDNRCGNENYDENNNYIQPMRPPGRIGHVSGVSSDGVLHIIGGDSVCVDESISFNHPDKGVNLTIWSAPILSLLLEENVNSTIAFTKGEKNSTMDSTENIHDVSYASLNWTHSIGNYSAADNPLPRNRGSMSGSIWKEMDAIIFHGGMHFSSSLDVFGDVWAYYMKNNTFEMLAEGPNSPYASEIGTSLPDSRVAHATDIRNNVMYMFGGMGASVQSDIYGNKIASTWSTLPDVWEFDLNKRKWSKRDVLPSTLARAYHSLVVTEDEAILSFGGNRKGRDPMNDPVLYVFNDLLVLEKASNKWKTIKEPKNRYTANPSFRFDHSAIIDSLGNMFVWGGKYQSVIEISGLWQFRVPAIDFLDTQLIDARPDEIDLYEANMKSFQLLVLTIMFGGMLLVALYTTFRWHSIQRDNANANQIWGSNGNSNGASEAIFNAIPSKTYQCSERSLSDVTDDDTGEAGCFEDCCAICLDRYNDGDQLKCLPCGHEFHMACIEEWIRNHNSSCPSCRQQLTTTTLVEENNVALGESDSGIGRMANFFNRRQRRTTRTAPMFNLLTARHSDEAIVQIETTGEVQPV